MSKDFKVKNGLQVTTNITASGNISASGNILTSGEVRATNLRFDQGNSTGIILNGGDKPIISLNAAGALTFGAIHSSNTQHKGVNIFVTGSTPDGLFLDTSANVTASGNISASGTFIGKSLSLSNVSLSDTNTDAEYLFPIFQDEGTLEVSNGIKFNPSTDTVTIGGNKIYLTATGGNITASGNISASGTITMLTASIGGGIFTSASLAAGGGGGGSVSGNTFASDLKIGRDSQNLIDFASTDNQIKYRLNDVDEFLMLENVFSPVTDLGAGLGFVGKQFSELVVGKITASGDISASGKVFVTGTISGDGDIIAGSKLKLGSSGLKLQELNGGINVQDGAFSAHHITASGNISASGTLSGDDLVLRDDTQATNTPSVQLRNDTNHPGAQQSILFSSGSPSPSAGNDTARINFIPQATVGSFMLDNFIATGTISLRTNNVTRLEASATGIDVTGNITASGDISASGTIKAEHLHSTDDIEIGDSIIHSGDTDTKIGFSTDKITFTAGGVSLLTLEEASNDVAIFSNNISASNTSGVHVFGGSTTFSGNTSFGGFINNVGAGVGAKHINVNTSELTGSFHGGANLASGIGSFIINYGDADTFSGSLSNAGNGYGEIVSHFDINSAVNAGDLVYYNGSDFRHTDADGSGASTALLGVAMVDGASSPGPVLLRGIVRLGAGHIVDTSGDDGDVLYVSTTLGHVQFAAPSGASDIARIVGYCMNEANDVIYFNPSSTFVEVG